MGGVVDAADAGTNRGDVELVEAGVAGIVGAADSVFQVRGGLAVAHDEERCHARMMDRRRRARNGAGGEVALVRVEQRRLGRAMMARMRDARLVLLEGMPGSGKSSMAHALQRRLAALEAPHRWWYEGEQGHPLYTFSDWKSMDAWIGELCSGDAQRVEAAVAVTLSQWRRLGEVLAAREEVVLFDGMLYGHVGWTLFAGDAPAETIREYVAAAEEAVEPMGALLVYLRPDDVRRAVERITERRGQGWRDRKVAQTAGYAYCKRRGLGGFDGMVRFWEDFRDLTDDLFARSRLSKRRIANDAGEWEAYEREVWELLGAPSGDGARMTIDGHPAIAEVERFAGTYEYERGGQPRECRVEVEGGELFVTGVPELWPRTRLIPEGDGGMRFAAESFPFACTFQAEGNGRITEMRLSGPAFVWGGLPERYLKRG